VALLAGGLALVWVARRGYKARERVTAKPVAEPNVA
jgi:hypothetical protein